MTTTDIFARTDGAGSPSFSTDGQTIFHLRGGALPQLWAMRRDGTEARPLALLGEKVGTVRRAPKDDRILFGIDAGGDERQQLWLWQEGLARPLTAAGRVVHEFGCWSPDGTACAYTANDRDEAHLDVFVRTGEDAPRRLKQGRHQITAPAWHPTKPLLLLIDNRAEGDQRLSLLDVDTGEEMPVPHRRPTAFASLRWTKDGSALQGLSDAGGEFMALCRIDPASGAVTPMVEAPGADLEAWSLSPDGTRLAVVENDRGWARLRVGAAGALPPPVALPPGTVADLAWSPDGGTLAFCHATPTQPSGLSLLDAASGRVDSVWSPAAPPNCRPFELVEWDSNGRAVPGWMVRPAGTPPAAGWPTVVWVHGGPAGQSRATWRPDIQALAAQGYAVLLPNVLGSTGYGRTATASDDGARRPGTVDELAAAHAWLAAQPGLDPARIGIMGQSYGGYMVLAAITRFPALWRAAVNFYGIADFATLLDATGPWRREHRGFEYAGGPLDTPEAAVLFDQISPIRLAERITAPLLVLHGTRDPRVPLGESEQIVAALRGRGHPVRFETFDYAGHGFIRPADRCRTYAAVAAFFDEYL